MAAAEEHQARYALAKPDGDQHFGPGPLGDGMVVAQGGGEYGRMQRETARHDDGGIRGAQSGGGGGGGPLEVFQLIGESGAILDPRGKGGEAALAEPRTGEPRL